MSFVGYLQFHLCIWYWCCSIFAGFNFHAEIRDINFNGGKQGCDTFQTLFTAVYLMEWKFLEFLGLYGGYRKCKQLSMPEFDIKSMF